MTTRLAVFVVCLISAAASALPLTDTQHGFTMDVPEGSVRQPEADFPGALHTFRRAASETASHPRAGRDSIRITGSQN